jgi:hypothetical protein
MMRSMEASTKPCASRSCTTSRAHLWGDGKYTEEIRFTFIGVCRCVERRRPRDNVVRLYNTEDSELERKREGDGLMDKSLAVRAKVRLTHTSSSPLVDMNSTRHPADCPHLTIFTHTLTRTHTLQVKREYERCGNTEKVLRQTP